MPTDTPRLQVSLAAKPWWRSRTLWLNASVLALAAAEAHLGLLQPLLHLNVFALVAFALPVLNALLRVVTTQALQVGSQPPAAPGAAP
jgi:hypothetical protein